jgi:type IV pilus assembly protein PilO
MALIPEDPKQRNALLAIILTVAAVYGAYTYLYSPDKVELDAMQVHVNDLQTKNRQAQIQAARGGQDLEARNALYERHLMELEQLIPQTEEVPQLMRTLTSEARSANVEVSTLTQEPDQPSEFYIRKSWTLSVYGEYDDVGRFITSIATLPRIITPINVDLAPFPIPTTVAPMDLQSPVTATFGIELYVLPDPSSIPADSAAVPPPPVAGTGG